MRRILALGLAMVILAGLITGCGGGKGLQRISGLSPEQVVATLQDLAKHKKYEEAALYVSPVSLTEAKGVNSFLKDNLGLTDVTSSNLLSARELGRTGDFAAVLATLQDGVNTSNISIKVVGMERIDGEWYLVDNDTIAREAKYRLLQNLISEVL